MKWKLLKVTSIKQRNICFNLCLWPKATGQYIRDGRYVHYRNKNQHIIHNRRRGRHCRKRELFLSTATWVQSASTSSLEKLSSSNLRPTSFWMVKSNNWKHIFKTNISGCYSTNFEMQNIAVRYISYVFAFCFIAVSDDNKIH